MHDLADDEKICPHDGSTLKLMGDQISEQLDIAKKVLEDNGIKINDLPYLSRFEVDGRSIFASYLNFYICNGAVLVPVAGEDPDLDAEAVSELKKYWPNHEVIEISMRAGPM